MKEETSAHVLCECEAQASHSLCECEAWASLRYMYLGSFFLEPGDIKDMGLGADWSFGKATGLP
jgi:hypothetical protein